MCGIAGIYSFSAQSVERDLIQRMCNSMVHRGPDSEGIYICKNVGLGARRLRIIDLVKGEQPIHNEDETLFVVFNGEIYNFKSLRGVLERKGHRFYTNSDTEVIVHLYEEYKEDCVNYMRGMFAFAIYDKNRNSIFLTRDRVGIKPLYYYQDANCFIFSSELKPILQCGVSVEVDPLAIDSYMTFLYIPHPLSVFKQIRKLPPAHYLVCDKSGTQLKRYWDLRFADRPAGIQQWKDNLFDLLLETVELHLVSDVPIGIFLSGGMDSSSITGFASMAATSPVHTISLGYEVEKEFDELYYANVVADHFDTAHREYIVKPKVFEMLPDIIRYLEEPFADSSSILTYLVSKLAKKEVTVALTGIGGDENFGGYPRYLGMELAKLYERVPMLLRKSVFPQLASFLPQQPARRSLADYAKRFTKAGTLFPLERYLSWISFFDQYTKKELYTKEFQKSIGDFDPFYRHRAYFEEANAPDTLDRIFYLDLKTYLCDDLLFMADKMSMASSLELRVPFCDHRLLELSAAMPYRMKIKGLKMKSLFKQTMKGLLPAQILRRGKYGFMVPLALWIKKEMWDFINSYLTEDSIKRRGYFNYKCVRKILDDHYSGRAVYSDQIWALLCFELWHRSFIDKEPRWRF